MMIPIAHALPQNIHTCYLPLSFFHSYYGVLFTILNVKKYCNGPEFSNSRFKQSYESFVCSESVSKHSIAILVSHKPRQR